MSISSVDSGPLHVKPEVDLNLTTEANRVLYVLNKILSRTTIVGLLQELMKNNGAILKNILDGNSYFRVMEECTKYNIPTMNPSSSSSENFDSSESSIKLSKMSSDADKGSTKKDMDHESTSSGTGLEISKISEGSGDSEAGGKRKYNKLSEIIYILEEKPEVRKLVESMKTEMTPEMKFFIKILTEFRDRMEIRLNENAQQYKTKEKYMRETYEKNEKAKKEIEKLEEELLVTKTDANVCLIGRNILIKRHQRKIQQAQQNSQEVIEKRVKESEKAMVNSWKLSTVKQEHLKDDFLQASEKYSSLLKEHLATEKILRAKRAKVENQVLGWIQKFDQDIGEKQAEEEEIQALLDKETNELNEIQNKLDEQQEEYDELMQEKAQYEEEMLDRRLYQFIVNRSARRIQRSFRLYKAHKLAKKLAKKSKKGKKKQ